MTDPTPDDGFRILRLSVSNVMRLVAVDISPNPEGSIVVVAGANSQGKSSVLNAIWLALAGGDASRKIPDPIRHGEDTAEVTVDLGTMIVTRTWDANRRDVTKLTVTNADGYQVRSPQSLLDSFIGALSFDPLEFANQSRTEQVETLLGVVTLPFDLVAHDAVHDDLFQRRRDAKRALAALEARVEAATPPADGTPDEPVSASDLFTEHRQLREIIAANDEVRRQLAAAQEATTQAVAKVVELEAQLAAAQQAAAEATQVRDWLAEEVPHLVDPDLSEIEAALEAVDIVNAAVRQAADYRALVTERNEALGAVGDLELLLAENVATRDKAMREADMPVDGLTLERDGVYYQGVPFAQVSSSEQIRVSLGIAMALNPKLKVVRIKDGSLLDEASLALVEQEAAKHGVQVWLEAVGDRDDATVIIEDGRVKD